MPSFPEKSKQAELSYKGRGNNISFHEIATINLLSNPNELMEMGDKQSSSNLSFSQDSPNSQQNYLFLHQNPYIVSAYFFTFMVLSFILIQTFVKIRSK